jgi:hypothetical protein
VGDEADRGLPHRALGLAPGRQKFTQVADIGRGASVLQADGGERAARALLGGAVDEGFEFVKLDLDALAHDRGARTIAAPTGRTDMGTSFGRGQRPGGKG